MGGWSSACQSYIESATECTALPDDEEYQELSFLWGCGKALPCITGPINVSVDLKYDVPCL